MEEDIRKVLIDAGRIEAKVAEIGRRITEDYRGLELCVVGVLRGCVPFTADLVRRVALPLSLDFFGITSYAPAARRAGAVRITKDLDEDIMGRHVLLIEGIVDTGLTLSYVLRTLDLHKPASLRVCTLLDKPARRLLEVPIAYKGFDIPDEYVVGYGLDWRQRYRNLPFIGLLKPERMT